MKKYFVVTDVHGEYGEMITALTNQGFDISNPDHIFVSLGDIIDRGTESRALLLFVTTLPKDRRILIRGNHEDMFEDVLKTDTLLPADYHNGVLSTINSLAQTELTKLSPITDVMAALARIRKDRLWENYISQCVDYYELPDYILVHGWIPCLCLPDGSYSPLNWRKCKDWTSARWINGMDAWNKGIREPNKTILCGHWHTSWGHSKLHGLGLEYLPEPPYTINPYLAENDRYAYFIPFIDKGIVALDSCVHYSGFLNCYVIKQ